MWAVGRHTFYSPTSSGSIFHWARKLPAKYLSLGSGSGCTFFCQKLPERLWDLWGWLGHDPTPDRHLLQFPEQQHRTGRTYVLSDLDREASSSVCQWERSVTQTAWASCLAQAVTRSTSFSSKLITTQNKPPPLVFKRSNREWGENRQNKDRSQTQDIGSASSNGYLGAQFSWGLRITVQRWCLTSPDTSKSHQVRRELVNLNYFLLGHCSSLLGLYFSREQVWMEVWVTENVGSFRMQSISFCWVQIREGHIEGPSLDTILESMEERRSFLNITLNPSGILNYHSKKGRCELRNGSSPVREASTHPEFAAQSGSSYLLHPSSSSACG